MKKKHLRVLLESSLSLLPQKRHKGRKLDIKASLVVHR